MKIAGYCLFFIYALLTIFANIKTKKTPRAFVLMAISGFLMGLASLFLSDTFFVLSIIFLCVSLLMYHGLAVLQGLIMYHKIHLKHHVVRLILDIILLCLILI